jgi:hypothetical protein
MDGGRNDYGVKLGILQELFEVAFSGYCRIERRDVFETLFSQIANGL